MAILLALVAATGWGAADFWGGQASKKISPFSVALGMEVVGLMVVVPVVLVLGGSPSNLDLFWGFAGGAIGIIALAYFYGALARGTMSVVAPTTAAAASLTPVTFGLLRGERPTLLAAVGVVFAIVAIVMVSRSDDRATDSPIKASWHSSEIFQAILCGFAFGLFLILLDQPRAEAEAWPALSARVGATMSMSVFMLIKRERPRFERSSSSLVLASGLADALGVVSYSLASHRGLLTIVAVLGSLYPVVTVILAQTILGERFSRFQGAAVALAMVGVGLVSFG